ncbi:MAG: tyrosinase family protein [Gemmataceae bacterium]
MPERMSRRTFLVAAGLAGATATDAAAFGGRRRLCPPQPCPLPPCPPRPWPPDNTLQVRQNVHALSPEQLESLRRGVAAMKALPDSDPRSWRFQANMHWTTGTPTNPLFNQCQHGTQHFLSWHRAYLHFFERILRQQSGDAALCLPYWDWDTSRVLPDAYRVPDSASNPLWHPGRTLNDGSPLQPEDVSGLSGALAAGGYPGAGGFNSLLEDNPHGTVHGAVGGDMGSVPTAARDPIFWLHHANVDRLWDVWLAQGGGHTNPADAAWLDQSFPFVDESGNTVQARVGDYVSSARLGYRYDTTPPSVVVTAMVMAAGPPPVQPRLVAASAPADTPLNKVESKPLGFAIERVRVQAVSPATRTSMMAFPAPQSGSGGRVYIRVEGISAAGTPVGVRYGVYLNPPAAALTGDGRLQYHIGTINFFGKTLPELKMPGHGHAEHAGGPAGAFDQTFDATAVVARLRQTGQWNPDALDVVIMPIANVPPGQSAEATQVKAQASLKAADVRYKRIAVLQD